MSRFHPPLRASQPLEFSYCLPLGRPVIYKRHSWVLVRDLSPGHDVYFIRRFPPLRTICNRARKDVGFSGSRTATGTAGRSAIRIYSVEQGSRPTPSENFESPGRQLRLDELTDHLAETGLTSSNFELIGPDFDLAAAISESGWVPGVDTTEAGKRVALGGGSLYRSGEVEGGGVASRYGRKNVVRYLSNLGVDIDLLEDILLPDDVTVMQERAQFLQGLSLDAADILNQYPPLAGCSVRKNFLPVLEYLERAVLISRADLPELLKKYPRILNSSVKIDLEPLLDYLMGFGIQRKNLGGMLVRYPEILGFRLEGTMSTSVAYLVALGVEPRSMVNILTQLPEILGMRVGNNLLPKVEFYLSLGIQSKDLPRLFAKYPFLLGYNLKTVMTPAVRALETTGIKRAQIGGLILKCPQILGLKIEALIGPAADWLQDRLGIQKEYFATSVLQSPHVLVLDRDAGDEKIKLLLESGFQLPDVQKLLGSFPQLLRLSESSFRPRLEYILGRMGRSVEDIVAYPQSLACSVEKLKSRYEPVRLWGTKCSLAWILEGSDESFDVKVREFEDNGDI